jgi:hypothetical protein
MRKWYLSIAALLALVACVPAATAASWHDDFNGYSLGTVPSPWVTGTYGNGMKVWDTIYNPDGSKCLTWDFWNPSNPDCGASFREIDSSGAGYAYATVRLNADGYTQFGVFSSTSSYVYGANAQDRAVFYLYNFFGTGPNYNASVYDNGTELSSSGQMGMSGVWYDVRILWTADRKTFTFQFKAYGTNDPWTTGYVYAAPSPLDINYVGIAGGAYTGNGMADSIGYMKAGGWYEDFESYPVGNLPSPWATGSYGQPVQVSANYPTDKQAYYAAVYPNPALGTSFRPIDATGAGSVTTDVRVIEGSCVRFGVYQSTASYQYGASRPGDLVEFMLDNMFWDRANKFAQVWDNGVNVSNTAVTFNWYDSQLQRISWTADRKTFTLEYKTNGTLSVGPWTLAAVYTNPTPMNINYVGISMGIWSAGTTPGVRWVDYSRPKGSITGKVTLADYAGDPQYVLVKVELRNRGGVTPVETRKVTLGSDGSYSLSDVVAGNYDVVFKALSWLQKSVPVTVTNLQTTPNVNVTLTSGDLDGDNEVTSTDVSAGVKTNGTGGDQ